MYLFNRDHIFNSKLGAGIQGKGWCVVYINILSFQGKNTMRGKKSLQILAAVLVNTTKNNSVLKDLLGRDRAL